MRPRIKTNSLVSLTTPVCSPAFHDPSHNHGPGGLIPPNCGTLRDRAIYLFKKIIVSYLKKSSRTFLVKLTVHTFSYVLFKSVLLFVS